MLDLLDLVVMAKIVALIPARGGSKGIVQKNLQTVGGLPLVLRSIRHAQAAASIDEVYVSTEDPQIAEVATRAGAQLIDRPASLAADDSSTESVVNHALDHWWTQGSQVDAVVLLQCTSPFRSPGQLEAALQQFQSEDADSMLSVIDEHTFYWVDTDAGCVAQNYDPANRPRRQECNSLLRETGSFYIFKREVFEEQGHRLGGRVRPFIVPSADAIDIDTPEQLAQARRQWELRGEVLELYSPQSLRWLVLDVDGTLTDATLDYSEYGFESKRFNTRDGHGIARWRKAGGRVAWITAAQHEMVSARARHLNVDFLAMGCSDKQFAVEQLRARYRLGPHSIIAMGDDEHDLGMAKAADYFVAPSDAQIEVIAAADWVTQRRGGHGAVRELIDGLLRQGAGQDAQPGRSQPQSGDSSAASDASKAA